MGKLFGNFDKPLFWITLIVMAVTITIGISMPEQFENGLNAINAFATTNFGWWYMLCIAICIIFMLWCALSQYGNLKLGGENDRPEYSYFSWFAMLFSCGIGVGFIFWGVAEPMNHFMSPPPYSPYAAGDPKAAAFAMQVSLLHWGIHGWIPYTTVGLAISYFAYRNNRPMTVANSLYGLLGNRVNGKWGKLIDFLAAFATICGISTSLGMALLSMSFAINKLFGLEINTALLVLLDLAIIIAYIISATSGISKGYKAFKRSQRFYGIMHTGLCFICRSDEICLNLFTESIGNYLQNFVFMTFYSGTSDQSGWIGNWTIFYWGWWIAWAPFVGGFVAEYQKVEQFASLW